MSAVAKTPRFSRKHFLLIAVLVVALYVITPQLRAFHSSWHLLLHPQATWVATALLLTAGTYLAAAGTYYLLAFRTLHYGATVLVQLAAMFVNRLLPSGVGALGVNYAYLRRMKHTLGQAGSIVALNNLLGALGHGLLLVLVVISAGSAAALPAHDSTLSHLLKLLLVITAVMVVAILFLRRGRLREIRRDIIQSILGYRQRSWRLPAALLSSMLLTLGNVLCLVCCGLALGINLPLVAWMIIFTFGIGTSTAVPTPGGLGGFEAGLTAGMIAYHVPRPEALAIALLYRLASYWVPLLVGGGAFVVCQKQQLFGR
jgi:glycosyltransferase 2 family protein